MLNLGEILQDIKKATKISIINYQISPTCGNNINTTYKLQTKDSVFFIKLNGPLLIDMIKAEALGLEELRKLSSLRIHQVICCGATNEHSYIAMEYIRLSGLRNQSSYKLGQQLSQLHRHHQYFFGYHVNNNIGSTPQYNNSGHD